MATASTTVSYSTGAAPAVVASTTVNYQTGPVIPVTASTTVAYQTGPSGLGGAYRYVGGVVKRVSHYLYYGGAVHPVLVTPKPAGVYDSSVYDSSSYGA